MSERSVLAHPGIEPGWMLDHQWELDGATVRAIGETDLDHLRRWRNEQQEVLRQQAPLSREHQLNWFRSIVEPCYASERFPAALLVVVEEDGEPTSYGGLTNIEWVSRRGEVSFLAASERARAPRRYAAEITRFLSWLFDFTFETISFNRLFTETWEFRHHHIELLERAGMTKEGRLRQHVAKDGLLHDALIHGILAGDRTHR